MANAGTCCRGVAGAGAEAEAATDREKAREGCVETETAPQRQRQRQSQRHIIIIIYLQMRTLLKSVSSHSVFPKGGEMSETGATVRTLEWFLPGVCPMMTLGC